MLSNLIDIADRDIFTAQNSGDRHSEKTSPLYNEYNDAILNI